MLQNSTEKYDIQCSMKFTWFKMANMNEHRKYLPENLNLFSFELYNLELVPNICFQSPRVYLIFPENFCEDFFISKIL